MIVALAGRAGSGKNTVAKLLGAHEVSFAEPLKEICRDVFGFTTEQLYGPSERRNAPDPRFPRADGTCLSPREALQKLGTEWGRACFPDVWAQLGIRRAQEAQASALCVGRIIALTDCRFVNEARAVRAAGGEVWRIVRPGAGLAGTAGLHPSEAEQESPEFLALVNRTIYNNGTIDALRLAVALA